MGILKKTPGKDFTVLNLTDIHWDIVAWMPGNKEYETVVGTIRELIARTQPDLITVSGDLSWGMAVESYVAVADLLDSFGIPWAPVWGNHDNQSIDNQNARYQAQKHSQRIGHFLHALRQKTLELLLIEIAHRPQQIGQNSAVYKGRKDLAQLPQRVFDTLQPEQQEKHQNTQADGSKYGKHQVRISSLVRIFHFIPSFPKQIVHTVVSIPVLIPVRLNNL